MKRIGFRAVCALGRMSRVEQLRYSIRSVATVTGVRLAVARKTAVHTMANTSADPKADRSESAEEAISSAVPGESDVGAAQRLYSLTKHHKSICDDPSHRPSVADTIAREAWRLMDSLDTAAVEQMSTSDVAEIVVAYHYFSCFWENGLSGPSTSVKDSGDEGVPQQCSPSPTSDEEPLRYPILNREEGVPCMGAATASGLGNSTSMESSAPVRRANPLDEVLDF